MTKLEPYKTSYLWDVYMQIAKEQLQKAEEDRDKSWAERQRIDREWSSW